MNAIEQRPSRGARKDNALISTSCWWRLDTKHSTPYFGQGDIEISLAADLANPELEFDDMQVPRDHGFSQVKLNQSRWI